LENVTPPPVRWLNAAGVTNSTRGNSLPITPENPDPWRRQ
jgi:hypothetical protein